MTVLTNKHILVVGDENSQIQNLEQILKGHGMVIHTAACDSVTTELVEEKSIDLILLNHLHEGEVCRQMLNSLRSADLTKVVPVFVLVEDTDEKIQEAFTHGAADYITPDEDIGSVVQKMKTIFGQGDNYSDISTIDITPTEASVTATGIRVYIVEDDPLLRNLLSIKLEKSSFPFEFSSDGKDAIPAMRQFKPDIIILDLMLPGKSGFDVLAEVKADEQLKDVPVIVFSNRDGQDDRHKATDLGAVGFYVKAMTDLSELIETIESHVK